MSSTKKASGRNIPEDERNTERLNLRIDAEAMALLCFFATAWRCSKREVIETLLTEADQHKGKAEDT